MVSVAIDRSALLRARSILLRQLGVVAACTWPLMAHSTPWRATSPNSAHDQPTAIYAEVACTGRAFVDRHGVRVEQLTITQLARSESFWADEATMTRAAADLTARYGIVIDGMNAVPGWVRDNDRPTGAPTADVDIDLDGLVERLTLAAEPKCDPGWPGHNCPRTPNTRVFGVVGHTPARSEIVVN